MNLNHAFISRMWKKADLWDVAENGKVKCNENSKLSFTLNKKKSYHGLEANLGGRRQDYFSATSFKCIQKYFIFVSPCCLTFAE